MNLLVDPGFELMSPAWVPDVNGGAAFSGVQVHSGSVAGHLRRLLVGEEVTFWFSGNFTQSSIPMVLGETHIVRVWVHTIVTASNIGLRVSVDRGSGSFTINQNFVSLPLGWSQVELAPFVAIGSGVGRLQLQIVGPAAGPAGIYVDDVEWDWPGGDEVARRSKHTAFNAVITRLKTIQGGSSYHTDLGQRVYPLLFLPEERAGVPLPYACFPLIDTFNITDNERATLDVMWEADVHVFIAEESSDPMTSLSSEHAAQATDDVLKALKADETLGGACQDLTILGGATEAGALVDGRAYGEAIIRIRIRQIVGVDVLGPE